MATLCDRYGTDKGSLGQTSVSTYPWPSHSYSAYYEKLFSRKRQEIENLFECGIGTNNVRIMSNMSSSGIPGASLRMWREYFPGAQVIAGDIDPDALIFEERITSFQLDQLDPKSITYFWSKQSVEFVDVIIDDGLHTFEAGSTLFMNSIGHLKQDGIYIIEDVDLQDLEKYDAFFNHEIYDVEYVFLSPLSQSVRHNSIITVQKIYKEA